VDGHSDLVPWSLVGLDEPGILESPQVAVDAGVVEVKCGGQLHDDESDAFWRSLGWQEQRYRRRSGHPMTPGDPQGRHLELGKRGRPPNLRR
jgi:hypothetical protein